MKCTVFPYKLLLLPSFLLYNKDWGLILQWTNPPAPSASTSRFVKWEHSTRWGSRESRSGPGVCNVLQPQASVSNLSHRPTTPRHPRTPTRLQSLRATAPVRRHSQDARGRCGVQSACVGAPGSLAAAGWEMAVRPSSRWSAGWVTGAHPASRARQAPAAGAGIHKRRSGKAAEQRMGARSGSASPLCRTGGCTDQIEV